MKNKKFLPFIISAVVILVGIVSLIAQGLNLGIDFRSGKIVTIDMGRELDTQVLEDMVTAAGGKDAVIKRLGDTAYSIQFYVDEEEFANMTPSAQSTQSARPSASPSSGQTAQIPAALLLLPVPTALEQLKIRRESRLGILPLIRRALRVPLRLRVPLPLPPPLLQIQATL